jgi:hypothetical protein
VDRRLALGIVAAVCAAGGVVTALLLEAPPAPSAPAGPPAAARPRTNAALPRPDTDDAGLLDPDRTLTPEVFQADMGALRPALLGCMEDAPVGTRIDLGLALSPDRLKGAFAESTPLPEAVAVCLGDLVWTHRWATPTTALTIRYPLVVPEPGVVRQQGLVRPDSP